MTYLRTCAATQMALNISPAHVTGISKRALNYRCTINKIPEKWKVNSENFYILPCSNDFSLVGTYTEFFDIIEILYNKKKLREDVLTHIKQQRGYYTKVSQSYLARKKLDFLHWYVGVTDVKITADELLVFACSVYLNIHITVDYLTGLWSTLDIPDISHNLAVVLLDVHLAYRGNCNFSLLCKKSELQTKARKLFNRDTPNHLIVLKELQVSIHHLDDKKICPKVKKLMTDKDYLTRYLGTQIQHRYLCVKLTWLESMENSLVEESTLSTIHDDSDDTEIYELEERTIGTLTFIENTEEVLPTNRKVLKTTKDSTKEKNF